MKNYFSRLRLPRRVTQSEISDAITVAMDNTIDVQSICDAEVILLDKVTRAYYERTHLQYEAISAALFCLDAPIAIDSHQWRARVVEFEFDEEEEIPL